MTQASPTNDIDKKKLEDFVKKNIELNPRLLYDFFDNNEIYLQVLVSNNKWTHNTSVTPGIYFDNRQHSESNGILCSFEALENKLNR